MASTIQSANGAAAASRADGPISSGLGAAGSLGKQDFLNLLVAPLRNQDPMKPMENKEFIAQLAQFSSLEALSSINERFDALASASQVGQAAGLIGKYVEAGQGDGTTITGQVSEVRLSNGVPSLMVDGQAVGLARSCASAVQRPRLPTRPRAAPARRPLPRQRPRRAVRRSPRRRA
jgi:flagellar basal-body rod modification protein FlgD